MKIELKSIGKVLMLIFGGIEFKEFYQKKPEPGYKLLGEWNVPGTHEGYQHIYIGWRRKWLWITLHKAIKIAIKIV